MVSLDDNVALIFGASGISGWAVTNQLLSYPTTTTFSRVIGLTNRPVDLANSQLPTDDKRLEMYSGINLRGERPDLLAQMKEKIPGLEQVTHMYYLAYANASSYTVDVMAIASINIYMTGNAVHATDELCPNLKFITLQTGTNAYGVAVFQHHGKFEINTPLKESQPRLPSPLGDEIFYYGQVDLIKEAQKGKPWKWCEVRPDAIVGFTPGSTGMTFLEPLGLVMALWRYVHGPGAEIPFFGVKACYVHQNTDSSQDIIAKSEIYLSVVKPEEANGEAFNTADTDKPARWVEKWPVITSYFGLKGVPPIEPAETYYRADEFWAAHQEDYKRMCVVYGLRERSISPETWTFALMATFSLLVLDRHVSIDKIRSVGFSEGRKMCEGHFIGFERMVKANIIPAQDAWKSSA